jgi:hypothetical protein
VEISSVNFIPLLDLARSSCEICNYRPSGIGIEPIVAFFETDPG